MAQLDVLPQASPVLEREAALGAAERPLLGVNLAVDLERGRGGEAGPADLALVGPLLGVRPLVHLEVAVEEKLSGYFKFRKMQSFFFKFKEA